MKGNNTFVLNEATLIEAVQEYLTKRTKGDAPTVQSVKPTKDNYSTTQTFDVIVDGG